MGKGGGRGGKQDLLPGSVRGAGEPMAFPGVSSASLSPRGPSDRRTPRPFSSQDLWAFVMQMAAEG